MHKPCTYLLQFSGSPRADAAASFPHNLPASISFDRLLFAFGVTRISSTPKLNPRNRKYIVKSLARAESNLPDVSPP